MFEKRQRLGTSEYSRAITLDEVAQDDERAHDFVFGDALRTRAGQHDDGEVAVRGGVQVDVVAARERNDVFCSSCLVYLVGCSTTVMNLRSAAACRSMWSLQRQQIQMSFF